MRLVDQVVPQDRPIGDVGVEVHVAIAAYQGLPLGQAEGAVRVLDVAVLALGELDDRSAALGACGRELGENGARVERSALHPPGVHPVEVGGLQVERAEHDAGRRRPGVQHGQLGRRSHGVLGAAGAERDGQAEGNHGDAHTRTSPQCRRMGVKEVVRR